LAAKHGATYELTVKGEASPPLAATFAGLELHSGSGITVVRARLPDQAALHGLLDRVGALGLELLSLRQVADICPDLLPDAMPFRTQKFVPEAGCY
jgi:hypothetical protein